MSTICALPTSWATRIVAPPPVNRPRCPSGSAKYVELSMTRMWAELASSRPPPDDGTTQRCDHRDAPPYSILLNASCHRRHTCMKSAGLRSASWCSIRSRPRTEMITGAGEDDCLDSGTRGGSEEVDQLVDGGDVECVALFWAVQHDSRHAVISRCSMSRRVKRLGSRSMGMGTPRGGAACPSRYLRVTVTGRLV